MNMTTPSPPPSAPRPVVPKPGPPPQPGPAAPAREAVFVVTFRGAPFRTAVAAASIRTDPDWVYLHDLAGTRIATFPADAVLSVIQDTAVQRHADRIERGGPSTGRTRP